MEDTDYPQCQIIPIQMLYPDNAEKFLDGISNVPGVRRILVHGPGYLKDAVLHPREMCEPQIPLSTEVKIANQPVNMHVMMGDVIIEALDEQTIDVIADYCKEFFEDLPFQIMVGKFIKSGPSISDYLATEKIQDPDFIGLSDTRSIIAPSLIKQEAFDLCNV